MTTFSIKGNSEEAKAFIAYIKTLAFVDLIDDFSCFKEEISPYGKDFIEKIERAENEINAGGGVGINPKNIWGSLGLKS